MITPERIELDSEARALCIHWPDTAPQRIAYAALRAACRCTHCRRNGSRRTDDRFDDTSVMAIHPMGYGIQIVFSDGHERGIFPWAYLAQLSALTA